MSASEVRERPKAVTVIGWLWLVLAALSLFRSVMNLILWRVLQPAVPTLLGAVERQSPLHARFLRPLLELFGTYMAVVAIASVAVGFVAFQFLRLRPWARVAVEAVCWFLLAYVAAFAALSIRIWSRVSAAAATDPTFSAHSHASIRLAAGLAICAALATGLVVMIGLLRSPRVREAFRPQPPAEQRGP